MTRSIYHLAEEADVSAFEQSGEYVADSLSIEGFLHCCTAEQLPGVVQRYYAAATSLHVLTIEANQVSTLLTYENTVGGEELFPHVYGKLTRNAIIRIRQLNRSDLDRIATSEAYNEAE